MLVARLLADTQGFAFAEYVDTPTTDMAIAGLHNFQLGDRTLVVQRAEMGRNTGASGMGMVAHAILAQASNPEAAGPTSRVMLLLNMVTSDELYDDQDYQDILEDINEECGKYGEIEGVRVPRPVPKDKTWSANDSAAQTEARAKRIDEHHGVGRVYVLYKDVASAGKAMKALGGRQFAGRTILTASVPEVSFSPPEHVCASNRKLADCV
jgi:splicing factor U2AF subunit